MGWKTVAAGGGGRSERVNGDRRRLDLGGEHTLHVTDDLL